MTVLRIRNGRTYNTVRRRQWPLAMAVCILVAVAGGTTLVMRRPHRASETAETPRTPEGVWCRANVCQFWDASGARWGSALRSIGPLLLLVDDQRVDDTTDPKFIAGIASAAEGIQALGLRTRSVTLPDGEPGSIRIALTNGYDLLFDASGDVSDQLSTLAVFLADRSHDPAFKPQYLDLRTPGRVYYK